MPKPNRPLVRDGRLQAPKKRTDRSYLRPAAAPAADPAAAEGLPEDEAPDELEPDALPEAAAPAETEAPAESAPVSASDALPAPAPASAPPPAPARAAPASQPGRLPTNVRAIQQQGVRKRRDIDLGALARRDTSYAYHELRRIAVLATMVIVTLVVLWFVLR